MYINDNNIYITTIKNIENVLNFIYFFGIIVINIVSHIFYYEMW